ncbi:tRNA dimethylallyltransferase [Philodulcilactobacillus myokoensis]|uniref:tRNA dimethylallyltransferase n=1 Tax=Philodulcilactobacillus myokoensis TaxID=2929573 RepID=A0A9W6B184_9LACO|nr:tRNA (adenosine(37)-N6)-dimethylallyltransferase MiaA [Philodulcilactobacillus myokoensis]GLB46788.1 tRNA dimethylallyltransferase [Philodulcilactobacillus myokoensis]
MQKVLAIVGPTAVGKTALSLNLAHQFNGEIISGDSMQVYRHLNVGTAKIMKNEMQGIPHHLINIRDVYERYSAANFVNDAKREINEIKSRNRLPIIVGGTGFYLQALLNDLELGGNHYSNSDDRVRLKQYAEKNGKQKLWQRLYQIDPKSAKIIPVNNKRRVIRALEVCKQTDHLFSDQKQHKPLFNSFLIGLNTDRQLLYQRINYRVDVMVKSGLLDEAKWLYQQGGVNLPAGKGIGYRELDSYFNHSNELNRSIDLIKRDSRHYAKRQLTWFRNKMNVNWYDLIKNPKEINQIQNDVKKWLSE